MVTLHNDSSCPSCGGPEDAFVCTTCKGIQCRCHGVATVRGWLCAWCLGIVTAWVLAGNGQAFSDLAAAGITTTANR